MSNKLFMHERDKAWIRSCLSQGIDEEFLKKIMYNIGYDNSEDALQAVYDHFFRSHHQSLNSRLSTENKLRIISDDKQLLAHITNKELAERTELPLEQWKKIEGSEKQEILDHIQKKKLPSIDEIEKACKALSEDAKKFMNRHGYDFDKEELTKELLELCRKKMKQKGDEIE